MGYIPPPWPKKKPQKQGTMKRGAQFLQTLLHVQLQSLIGVTAVSDQEIVFYHLSLIYGRTHL